MISFPGDPLTRLRAEAGFTYYPGAPSAGVGPSHVDLEKAPVAVLSPKGARVVNLNYPPPFIYSLGDLYEIFMP